MIETIAPGSVQFRNIIRSRVLRISNWIRETLAKRWLTWSIIVLFFTSASIVALTSRPSIYDERFHIKIIELYSAQIWPQLVNGPDTVGLGDVQYTGSFLYHYLMSFPYRLIRAFGGSEYVTTVVLRLISSILVTVGVWIWHQVFVRITRSRVIANIALFFVTAVPLLPYLAGIVNYDNLLFPLAAAWLWSVILLVKRDGQSLTIWLLMLSLGCFASVTKYSFVPVFALGTIYFVLRYGRSTLVYFRQKSPFYTESIFAICAFAVLLLVGIGFVSSRYVVSLVQFGTPLPDCSRVASVEYCNAWGPWRRNREADIKFPDESSSWVSFVSMFFTEWAPRVIRLGLMEGVVGESGVIGARATSLTESLFFLACIGFLIVGILASRSIGKRFWWPMWGALVAHTLALYWLNYHERLQMGQWFATQFRYFLPFLPIIIVAAVSGYARLSRVICGRGVSAWNIGLGLFILLLMTQGAGVLYYLAAADARWIAPDSPINFVAEYGHNFSRWLLLKP